MRTGGRALVGVVALFGAAWLFAQGRPAAMAFEGARVIDGSGGPVVENAVLLIQDGRVAAFGARGSVTLPPGVVRVDVSGKSIMPAMINVHAHMGYEGYTTWSARNHTVANLLDLPNFKLPLQFRNVDIIFAQTEINRAGQVVGTLYGIPRLSIISRSDNREVGLRA